MTVNENARSLPNILITGTPGTGKTTTSEIASSLLNFKHINIGQLVKEKQLYEAYDSEFETYLIDEDKIVDELEDSMRDGGIIVDHHGCDFFPERWFDLVVVLRSSTNKLYDRLKDRKYNDKKLQENMECEIMQVVLEEAKESYAPEIVVELESNTLEDLEGNAERIKIWFDSWMVNNS